MHSKGLIFPRMTIKEMSEELWQLTFVNGGVQHPQQFWRIFRNMRDPE